MVDSQGRHAYLQAAGTQATRVPTIINLETRECYQMAFKPLHDRVLVRRIEGEDKTKGGLIIPDTAKEKPAEGEIISVGEGARKDSGELIKPSVKAGDKILFGKWSGTEVKLDGEDLLIMKESDILGIIA
jgi:chaperonin GroES